MQRKREQAGWRPVWDSGVKGWASKFIQKNKWRCDGVHDYDDLMQDAYLTFMKVVAAYPRVVEPKHFMALYKTAMTHEMTDRSRYKRRKDEVTIDVEVDEYALNLIGDLPNQGYLNALLSELPPELKQMLSAFTDDEVLAKLQAEKRTPRRPYRVKENLNRQIKRLVGIDNNTDLLKQLRAHLKEA
jgi:hypothetical protein